MILYLFATGKERDNIRANFVKKGIDFEVNL